MLIAMCRNYPTQSNLERKMKLMKVKEKRGDVLETSQFGYVKFIFLYAASVLPAFYQFWQTFIECKLMPVDYLCISVKHVYY